MLQSFFVSSPKAVTHLTDYSDISENNRQFSNRRVLQMRIVPCSAAQMSILAPRKVSAQQWGAYWGVNKMERLQKVLESLLVAYGGAWMAWFLSMLAGNVISSFTGTALIFNWMYSPWLNAKKRNAKVWRQGNQKLTYALYVGRIVSLKRVKRRAGKTIGAVSQEFLVMTVQDERQRELEIVTQWQEPYNKLRLQMRCENMIASSKKDFSVLSMVTDSWIPACGVWVGDYPYLDRSAFRNFVKTVEPMSDVRRKTNKKPSPDSGFSSGSDSKSGPSRNNGRIISDDGINKGNERGERGVRREKGMGQGLKEYEVRMDRDSAAAGYIADGNMPSADYFEGFSNENNESNAMTADISGEGGGLEDDLFAAYANSELQVNLDWEIFLEEKEAFAALEATSGERDAQKPSERMGRREK